MIGHREPVEAFSIGEGPQAPHVLERPAHVPDVDAEGERHAVT
jgi:hypothetical protein